MEFHRGRCWGPILFLIFINDFDDYLSNKVLKFADDTKVFKTVKTDTDEEILPDDLTKLVKWSENGRCYLILVNINASTLDMVM